MGMQVKNNEKKLFAFNSFTGIVQVVLTAILLFFCIPVFIANLGDEQYGVFAGVSVIGNLALYANLSFDATLIKYISEQGKCQESDYDIATMLLLLLIVIIPVSILLLIFKDFLLIQILGINIVYLESSSILITFLIFSNILLLLGKVFTSVLDARHKIYLTNFAMFIYSLIYWGGIIIIVLLGYGLKEVGKIIFFASIVWFLIVAILAIKEWGLIKISGFFGNLKRLVHKQLKYSLKIYTGSILGFLFEPITKVLISRFIGPASAGYYDIALRIKGQIVAVFTKILQPLYPTIAKTKDTDKIKTIMDKIMTGSLYIAIPAFVILLFCTEPFISLWLGDENVPIDIISISIIALVSSVIFFSIPAIPIYNFLRAKNHPAKEIYIQATNVIVNLILIIALYKSLGYYAALIGNFMSYVCSFVLCMYYQKKYLGILPLRIKKERIKYIICFLSVFLISLLFSIIILQFEIGSLLNIVFMLAVIGITTTAIFHYLKVFDKKDFSFK